MTMTMGSLDPWRSMSYDGGGGTPTRGGGAEDGEKGHQIRRPQVTTTIVEEVLHGRI